MKLIAVAVLFLSACLPAQDSKPARVEKPASAPASKPVEMTLLGRKVSLTIPEGWTETQTPSTFALDGWKPAKGWQSPAIKGFSVRVYGSEGKDLTPATLTKKWLDAAGSAKTEMMVAVAGKNRQLKGIDVEVEMSDNGAVAYYWLRAVGLSKDKVLVVLAEASPLTHETFEDVIAAAGAIHDSVLDPTNKDPWRRDPDVTVTQGTLVTKLTVPAGWKYGRSGSDALIWSGPLQGQEIELSFPQKLITAVMDNGQTIQLPAEQIFKLMVDLQKAMTDAGGKLISKTAIPGHDQATELVATIRRDPEGEAYEWTRQRIFLDAGTVVTVTATHPIPNAAAVPPDPFQKLLTAVMDSIKFEVAKKPK